jgi:hypothetical protein
MITSLLQALKPALLSSSTFTTLNKFTQGAINITINENTSTIQTPFEGNFMRMADKLQGKVVKDVTQPLMMRSLYSIGEKRFVFPDPAEKGVIGYESKNDFKAKGGDNALTVKVLADGQEKSVTVLGAKGKVGESKSVKIGELEYTFFYGSKAYTIPFSIKLNDFIDPILILFALLNIVIDWVVILGFFALDESMFPNLRCCSERFHS